MKLITATILLGAVSAVFGKTSNLRSSRQLQDEVVYGTYLEADIQYADHSDGHLDAIALPDGTILDIEDDDDADDDVKNRGRGWFRKHGYNSGDTQIALTGRVEGSKFKLKKLPQGKALAKGKDKRRLEEDRRRLKEGEFSVLALRVIADDASTSSSEAVISNKIFGTDGDPVNLKSQYAACSHGKLNFVPATGTGITDGVGTVSIPNTVVGAENSVIREAVTTAGNIEFGNMRDQFDYVMQCLPPGTKSNGNGWIAYAYVNWYLSVYNDVWCNYPSGQLHEIGHNLGLAHSGETATYDDQSGMMGFSYSQDDGPEMCFNAAKNFQLGWFDDKFETVNSTNMYWPGDLLGQINYNTASEAQRVGIRIAAEITGSNDDYYVSFNRKDSHNRGTVEGANQVLVHKRTAGDGYAESTLLAKLNAEGTYTIPNYGSILVNTIDLLATPAFATVSIGNAPPPTPAPVAPPTPAPVVPPTPAPVVPPTPAPVSPPTEAPTKAPTTPPTSGPTKPPTNPPPTEAPTKAPTNQPTTGAPTNQPTTRAPTESPSASPTKAPSISPTKAPTNQPTTGAPTKPPTEAPTSPFSCEATYSSKDTCNPDFRCFWGTKPSCSPTNSGNTARNKCCPSSGGPTPSPPPTPSPGPGPGPGPEPATCGEIPDNGTCKATSGCRWWKGSCVDGNGGAEFCFGKNGSCSTDSDCCSGSCKGNGRCE